MESDTPLGGTDGVVVLASESLEDLGGSIVHAHRNGNAQRALRIADNLRYLGALT